MRGPSLRPAPDAADDSAEVSAVEDEEPVEALGADGETTARDGAGPSVRGLPAVRSIFQPARSPGRHASRRARRSGSSPSATSPTTQLPTRRRCSTPPSPSVPTASSGSSPSHGEPGRTPSPTATSAPPHKSSHRRTRSRSASCATSRRRRRSSSARSVGPTWSRKEPAWPPGVMAPASPMRASRCALYASDRGRR
jgi:hypothetical protein